MYYLYIAGLSFNTYLTICSEASRRKALKAQDAKIVATNLKLSKASQTLSKLKLRLANKSVLTKDDYSSLSKAEAALRKQVERSQSLFNTGTGTTPIFQPRDFI